MLARVPKRTPIMTMCRLPQELLEGIADALDDDIEALRAYACISKVSYIASWRQPVMVLTLDSSSRCSSILAELSSNPEKTRLIGELRIIDSGWMNHDSAIMGIVQLLIRARSLRVLHLERGAVRSSFDRLMSSVALPQIDILGGLFHLPHLYHLTILDYTLPIHFLVLPALQHLVFCGEGGPFGRCLCCCARAGCASRHPAL